MDMGKCELTVCDGRKCLAKAKCPTKAIWQPEAGERPSWR